MENRIFILKRIEGEYAYLSEESTVGDDELFIALALLPEGADEGSRLSYNFPNFSLL